MRLSTLLTLFVCVVFISSGFRTAFGQDETPVEDGEKQVESKGDEKLDEAPAEPPEQSETIPAATGEEEVKGNLQADPHAPSEPELPESAEVGEVGEVGGVGEFEVVEPDQNVPDVEPVPKEPETEPLPDRPRSGNLDTFYGKRSLYTVAGKNCVCRSCSCTCEELDGADRTKNLGNFSRQRK